MTQICYIHFNLRTSKTHFYLFSVFVFILTFILSKMSLWFNFKFSIKTDNKPMGLFSGGLIFGSFFVHRIIGLIFGWAYFWVGLLSGNYGIQYAPKKRAPVWEFATGQKKIEIQQKRRKNHNRFLNFWLRFLLKILIS